MAATVWQTAKKKRRNRVGSTRGCDQVGFGKFVAPGGTVRLFFYGSLREPVP
jgi:hypothetical protein